jgi:hypothetical protein
MLQHRELVAAYRADTVRCSEPSYIISLEEWFDTWACRKLCGEKGWGELHHLDDGGVEEGAVEDADDDAPAPPPAPPPPKPHKTYDKANPLLMQIYTCWMHVWAADGSHAGWSTPKVLIGKAEQLELELKPSTAARYLAAEKVLYESGKGMRKKVNVGEMNVGELHEGASRAGSPQAGPRRRPRRPCLWTTRRWRRRSWRKQLFC